MLNHTLEFVTSISNSASTALTADQVTNFKVKIRIVPNSYKDLTDGKPENYSPFRPGMTATVDVITNKKNQVIGVPISSIVIKTDTSSVKKLKVKKKNMKRVQRRQKKKKSLKRRAIKIFPIYASRT